MDNKITGCYALFDCNNFYVSCERVFQPHLANIPVVVLSNNDGCVIARSNEAKKIGIKMGEPVFRIRSLVQRYSVKTLSSNFALYGDMSQRVMQIIAECFDNIQEYSIDEAFVNLNEYSLLDVKDLCLQVVKKIKTHTGIPASVGIAPTKTLAKLANNLAKKNGKRVFDLLSDDDIKKELKKFPVGDVWGIGSKLQVKLNNLNITTAYNLSKMHKALVKREHNIVLWRTILELQGYDAIILKNCGVSKKQIRVSRSFGVKVKDLPSLRSSLASYIIRASEKLRAQSSVCQDIIVFLQTSMHLPDNMRYNNWQNIELSAGTDDHVTIIKEANIALNDLYKPGYEYKKVGVILTNIINKSEMQLDIFAHNEITKTDNILNVFDDINQKFGKGTIKTASVDKCTTHLIKSENKSNEFTTKWDQLLRVY